MSNEELAERIRAGETDLIPELWKNVKGFIHQQAFRYFTQRPGQGGSELEDLVQNSYFALLNAIEDYKAESGYKFLTFLSYHLKNSFRECFGIKTTKRDPLNDELLSLDAPIAEDRGDAILADTIPDPSDHIEAAERRIWLEQLKAALSAALDQLPEEQRETITARYYSGLSIEEAAAATGTTTQECKKRERRGLDYLRKNKRTNGLEQFIDRNTLFYSRVGVQEFTATHSSATEKLVLFRERLREKQ